MPENWLPTGKPPRCSPATAGALSWNQERGHHLRRLRSMALWASGPPAVTRSRPYTGASNAVAQACAFVYCAKMAVIASAEPLNFGLYRTGAKGFVSATEYGQIRHGDTCEGSKGGLLIISRGGVMPESDPTVLVIDDDPEFRSSVGRLLRSVGLDARLFASAPDFLKSERPTGPTCLVLDVRLPGPSGLDFQRELAEADVQIPIIFITGHGDVPMSVQAMKRGAIEFLTKPFRDQDLIDAIQLGLARDRAGRENEKALYALRGRFEALTPREREVMIQVVQGRLNKQIADHIGISESTVKVHRSNLMQKMSVRSVVELGRMADQLQLWSENKKAVAQRC
jgi:FixJ family two-component response regulator